MLQRISYLRGRIKGTGCRGAYKTAWGRKRAMKELKVLKELYGKDQRFAD